MRSWDGWLPRLAATILAASTVTASGASDSNDAAPAAARYPASHYVVSTGEDQSPDAQGYQIGCADGRAGASGLRILFFGTQEQDGRIRPPGTTRSSPAARVTEDWVVSSSVGWMRGFAKCGRANAVLGLGVNNKSDGGADPATAGAAWANLVQRVGSAAQPGRVVVGGALDGEPAWSTASWARGWVDAFVRGTPRVLYAAGSADGCPSDASSQACSRGWTVGDVFHISTGASAGVVALPQIYRTDGIQARQWAAISGWGVRSGAGPLRVIGALSQRAACRQQSGCGKTDNSADDAASQLRQALSADPGTRTANQLTATDVDWSSPPPSP